MLPDLDLRRLFPGCGYSSTPSGHELELFAEYWDDNESERANVEAIRWWLDQVDRMPRDTA